MQYGIYIPRHRWEPVQEVSLADEEAVRDLLYGDPLPIPISELNLSMIVEGIVPGRRRWLNFRAARLAWFLAGGVIVPIYGAAILVSDDAESDRVPEPLRRRLLGLDGPFRIHLGLQDEESWFSQGHIQLDYFEAIEEAMDLHRDSMGTIEHIHIARADEVLLW